MAFADLKIPQVFWLNSGVKTLFYSQGIPVDSVKSADSNSSVGISRQELQKPAPSNPSRIVTTPGGVSRASKARISPESAPAQAKRQAVPFKSLRPELWPLIWQKQLMQAKTAKIAWTYWKLGEDLQKASASESHDSSARKERGALLRRFFTELALPGGTHTFWPAALPDENGNLAANPQVFWSGILELNCRGVVILGSQAARPLLPERVIRPLDELRMAGRIVWILRDPDALARNDSWFSLSVSLLRNAFRIYLH